MTRKPRHKHEASLVPLADMLANTVGIMLFILAFTVLASGGAMVTKRLPREHVQENQRSLMFLIRSDGIFPVDDVRLAQASKPANLSSAFNNSNDRDAVTSDAFFTYKTSVSFVRGSGDQILISPRVTLTPTSGGGVPVEKAIRDNGGVIARMLADHKPSEHFVYCLVEKAAISSFQAFREWVTQRWSYGVGWSPHDEGSAIVIGSSGGGTTMAPQ